MTNNNPFHVPKAIVWTEFDPEKNVVNVFTKVDNGTTSKYPIKVNFNVDKAAKQPVDDF